MIGIIFVLDRVYMYIQTNAYCTTPKKFKKIPTPTPTPSDTSILNLTVSQFDMNSYCLSSQLFNPVYVQLLKRGL